MPPKLGLVLGLLLRSRSLFLESRMREELSEDPLEMDGWRDEVVVMLCDHGPSAWGCGAGVKGRQRLNELGLEANWNGLPWES